MTKDSSNGDQEFIETKRKFYAVSTQGKKKGNVWKGFQGIKGST